MKRSMCTECGERFAQKRADLGFKTCLGCGEKAAQKQIGEKFMRIMPAYNKGGYTLLSSDLETAKSEARGMARKTENQ